jgi:orotidine-5'-phosphate decarboxylase
MSAGERVCIALDFSERAEILAAARRFAKKARWVKIGLEAFVANGPGIVGEVAAEGARVFLDLKLHDIPATVERAIAAAAGSGAAMVNVHALGGRAMLESAERSASRYGVTLIAVTLLTSLDAKALADLPVAGHPEGIARRLAVLAKDCGLAGVVCAATDLAAIRGACGPGFLTVVPGIRPGASASADQKRIATPAEAIRAGAGMLVVGRPVTAAPDPDRALNELLAEIESAS